MRKLLFVVLALILVFPALSVAEDAPPDYRWTIGYENGIVLRRFLGENWEVYLGGRPSIYSSNSEIQKLYSQDNYWGDEDLNSTTNMENNGAYIVFGVGRSLLREGRFWLVGLVDLQYYWDNTSWADFYEYPDLAAGAERGNIGHAWRTTLHLGVRPAFDISRRITIMVELGVAFYHSSSTRDEWCEDPDNIMWWDDSSQHTFNSRNDIDMYGYSGINSIRFMFRF